MNLEEFYAGLPIISKGSIGIRCRTACFGFICLMWWMPLDELKNTDFADSIETYEYLNQLNGVEYEYVRGVMCNYH